MNCALLTLVVKRILINRHEAEESILKPEKKKAQSWQNDVRWELSCIQALGENLK